MKIGIDAIGIEKASGGRTATVNLLRPLFEQDRKNQYLVAVSTFEEIFAGFENVRQWVIPARNRFLKRVVAQAAFPWKMRGCDVVHFTKNLSLWGPMPPKVVTVFDLSMLLYPQLMPRSDYWYWKTLQRRSLQEAAGVITISQSAARDIERFYRIPSWKIRVVYPGLASRFQPQSAERIAGVKARYHLPDDYLVHVGRIDPIKNLTNLVRAFGRLKASGAYAGKLVLVGQVYKKTPDTQLLPAIQALGLQEEVILAGYAGDFVRDEDLPAVLSGATAKVFPSLNEGFGFAPLEAMACGVPVIASRAGSLPEVLGNAALLLPENSVEVLALAMKRMVEDESLRQQLREAGLEHIKKYNWHASARQVQEIYQEFSEKRRAR